MRPNPVLMLVDSYDVCGNVLRAAAEAANQQVHPAFRRDQPFANCHLWQTRFADPATHAPVRSDIPTLILTAEFDDRDPTDYGRAIAATLSRSYLHEIPGRVHGPLFGACQDAMIMQFLDNPARPPDASCVGQSARTFETRSLDLQRFIFQIAIVGEPASLTGKWEVALPGPQNVTTIDLRVRGTMMSGTVAQPRGTAAILDGRFQQGTLTFKAISPDGQRTISLSGVVDGDHITFTRGLVVHPGGNPGGEGIFGALGPGSFTAARVN